MSDRSVLIHLAVAAILMALAALGVVVVDEATAKPGYTANTVWVMPLSDREG